jgi:hypothetical protein
MTTRFQLCPFLQIVEELTVEYRRYAPIFIGDRLLAIRQANNTEPPGAQGYAGTPKVAFLVRASVNYRLSHPLDDAVRHCSFSRQIHHAGDAAHTSQP